MVYRVMNDPAIEEIKPKCIMLDGASTWQMRTAARVGIRKCLAIGIRSISAGKGCVQQHRSTDNPGLPFVRTTARIAVPIPGFIDEKIKVERNLASGRHKAERQGCRIITTEAVEVIRAKKMAIAARCH